MMAAPQSGWRNVRIATQALIAVGVAGTIGASAMAYADTHVATATPAPAPAGPGLSGSGSGSSGLGSSSDPGYSGGYSSPPQLSPGSGHQHATSSGS